MTTIAVQGTGKAYGQADVATFSVMIENDGPTQQKTRTENNVLANRVIELLKEKKIEEKDIQASPAQCYPQYRPTSAKSKQVVGYHASNHIRVTVHDLDSLFDLTEGINALSDAVQITNVSFQIDSKNQLVDKAREEAFADAKRKADLYAKLIDAGWNTPNLCREVSRMKVLNIVEGLSQDRQAFGMMAQSLDASEIMQPGQQEITVTVDVIFEAE